MRGREHQQMQNKKTEPGVMYPQVAQASLGYHPLEADRVRRHHFERSDDLKRRQRALRRRKLGRSGVHHAAPKHTPEAIHRRKIADYLKSAAELHEQLAQREQEALRSYLDKARDLLAELPDQRRQAVESRLITQRLPATFYLWRHNSEKQSGSDMTWMDWLSNAEHGASDRQLLEVFRRSLDAMGQKAGEPEFHEKTEISRQHYIAALRRAVEAGELHPAMLENLQTLTTSPIYPGDAFDETLLEAEAYVEPNWKYAVVKDGYSQVEFFHEMIHLTGDFETKPLIEGFDEEVRQVLMEPSTLFYRQARRIVQSLGRISDMHLYDMSAFFGGPDGMQNEQNLRQEVEYRTGYDVVGFIHHAYKHGLHEYSDGQQDWTGRAQEYTEEGLANVEFMLQSLREGAPLQQTVGRVLQKLDTQKSLKISEAYQEDATRRAVDFVLSYHQQSATASA